MIEISLLEWLRTGRFGPVHLGMSRAEVEGVLGPPEMMGGRTSRRKRRPTIWKYGDVEMYFGGELEDPLHTVFLEGLSVPSEGQRLVIDPWRLRGGMGLEEAIQQLEAEGLRFEQRVNPVDKDYVELSLESGVKLSFGVVGQTPRGLTAMSAELRSRSAGEMP